MNVSSVFVSSGVTAELSPSPPADKILPSSEISSKRRLFSRASLWCIELYRAATVNRHRVCRFEPTCSHYASQALQQHGFWKGWGYSLMRLSRCRPGGGWGYDPVPDSTPSLVKAESPVFESTRSSPASSLCLASVASPQPLAPVAPHPSQSPTEYCSFNFINLQPSVTPPVLCPSSASLAQSPSSTK